MTTILHLRYPCSGEAEGEAIPGVVHTIGAATTLEEFDQRERG